MTLLDMSSRIKEHLALQFSDRPPVLNKDYNVGRCTKAYLDHSVLWDFLFMTIIGQRGVFSCITVRKSELVSFIK